MKFSALYNRPWATYIQFNSRADFIGRDHELGSLAMNQVMQTNGMT